MPSPSPTPETNTTYRSDLYGFSLRFPTAWTAEDTRAPSPVATFDTGITDLTARAFVFYYDDRLDPEEVAQQELAPLAGLPAFRTISEASIALGKDQDGYQVLYAFGAGQEERRGGMLFAVDGSRAFVVQVVGPRSAYERQLEAIDGFLNSFQVEAQRPFGTDRQKTLVLALDTGPITLDPALAQESQSIQYVRQVFSGLVSLDADLMVTPDLANWSVLPDGVTYIFNIDGAARFHDGRPVLAQDVIYSWERAANPALGSPTVGLYLDDIVGVREVMSGRSSKISGLAAVDDYVLKVTIDAPKSYFLAKLTHIVASVVDRDEVEADAAAWWRSPNGTGPFAMREWIPNVAMHLLRNPSHLRSVPTVENVVMRFHAGAPSHMFEDGEIDVALVSPEDVLALTREKSPIADQVITLSQLSVYSVGFNAATAPFDDVRVRRAFLLALDRKTLIDDTLGGVGSLAQGFLPPDLPGYDPMIAAIAFSPAEARAQLASSPYANAMPPITFTTTAGQNAALTRIAQMWRDNLGVSVIIKVLPAASYYADLKDNLGNLFDLGWVADYPDPYGFLDVLFRTGSPSNLGAFSGSDVDDLLDQARIETDEAARAGLYQQVERILVGRAAAIPLWHGQQRMLIQPEVHGFMIDASGRALLDRVSLTDR
ncbi:MAG: peptide ABC transporter substrate-binding protein [Chloroflexi bacterium]|nr:peptide ABC transporter substrate-binding protein [Chloroflexota bacterium]